MSDQDVWGKEAAAAQMAKLNANFEERFPNKFPVGSLVYQPYEPQRAGKVIGVEIRQRRPETLKYYRYTIRRPDGSTYTAEVLKDFRALIADHERKLATHHRLLASLEAMPERSDP